MTKYSILILWVCLVAGKISAQDPPDICETSLPMGWVPADGNLSLSETHFKQGKQSVKWDWKGKNASLKIADTAFAAAIKDQRSCYAVWVYNEHPVMDSLVFSFGNNACSFSFQLNFSGWRTAWVMYNRDMKGAPTSDMNSLQIKAPSSVKKGSLYLDAMMYVTTVDPRAPMRDMQVPFINPLNFDKSANAHWVNLYAFARMPDHLPAPKNISAKDIADIAAITERYEKYILPTTPAQKKQLKAIRQSFESYRIQRDGKNITGKPVNSMNAYEINHSIPVAQAKAYAKDEGILPAANLLLKMASAYRSSEINAADKIQIAQQFIDLLDHLHDQGWAYGSGMGSAHHLGYNFREYFSACLLMKDVLVKEKRWERTWKDMYWFSGQGRTHLQPELLPSSNIDVFNTLLGGMLATILIMDNTPQKVQQLQEFTQWLSHNIGPEYSIEGTFKPGGSVTHHGTLYPAYAIDGLQGLAPVIYVLSQTDFAVTAKAFDVVKESLLMMNRYTNPVYWPLSVSGRHPGKGKTIAEPYAYMALAGGSDAFDTSMAAIYLQTARGDKIQFVKDFKQRGIKAAAFPHGHWDMNYGLLSMHRRKDWLLTVRGHNRYFVTHESYPGNNMFGRYLTYGNLELFYPADTENNGTYFKDEGWDWNAIPGTTTLQVPLDKLRAKIINADDFSGVEEMLLTDEVYAGGTDLGQQGMYAMKLHGNDKYDMGSFRAIKSWFMFDNLIVCLGSNITNSIQEYPTITTLFQNYLTDSSASLFAGDRSITSFPFTKTWSKASELIILDNRNTGYYLMNAAQVNLSKTRQTSRNQEDTKSTTGNFAKLVIDHGHSPANASYAYAMLIDTDSTGLEKLAKEMKSAVPPFHIVQQDSIAHIVSFSSSQLTGCALLTANKPTNDALILDNDKSCLLMYKQQGNKLLFSVTDPDLGFYEGPDDTPKTADGKRKEVSIYSKPWYISPSRHSLLTFILKGKWKLEQAQDKMTLSYNQDGNTVLIAQCKDGAPTDVELVQ